MSFEGALAEELAARAVDETARVVVVFQVGLSAFAENSIPSDHIHPFRYFTKINLILLLVLFASISGALRNFLFLA